MRWEELERIEIEAEDARSFAVGDMIFGRVIARVQHVASDHLVVWVCSPSRWYVIRRWFRLLWWRFVRQLS